MIRVKEYIHSSFDVLKVRTYRLYFTGQSLSLVGTWMQTVGQAILVVQLTRSGTQLGLVVAAQFLPILLFAPWGGLIADRFPKRTILLITQSCAGVLAFILGGLVLLHLIQLWMVYVLAICLGIVNSVDNPTRNSFIFEMVGPEYISNAVSLNTTAVNLARIVGPAVAGVFIATIGLALCFIINGISFLAVIVVLLMMDTQTLLVKPAVKKMKGQIMEGLRYVNGNPVLKNTLIMMSIIGTLSYEFQVSLPLFAQFTFNNLNYYAWLTSAMGVGAIIGGLFTIKKSRVEAGTLINICLLFGISMIVSAIMPNIISAIIAFIFVGALSIAVITFGNVTLQMESVPEMRGRVLSFWTVAFLGSTPIGGPIIGWISEHAGARWGVAVGGLAAIVGASIGLRSLIYANRKNPNINPAK